MYNEIAMVDHAALCFVTRQVAPCVCQCAPSPTASQWWREPPHTPPNVASLSPLPSRFQPWWCTPTKWMTFPNVASLSSSCLLQTNRTDSIFTDVATLSSFFPVGFSQGDAHQLNWEHSPVWHCSLFPPSLFQPWWCVPTELTTSSCVASLSPSCLLQPWWCVPNELTAYSYVYCHSLLLTPVGSTVMHTIWMDSILLRGVTLFSF